MRAESKRSLKENFKLIVRGYKLVFRIWKRYIVWNLIKTGISTAAPYFSLYMTAQIVTELTGSCSVERLLRLVIIILIGNLLLKLIQRVIQGRVNVYGSDTWRQDLLFYLKTQSKMRFDYLEDPDVTLLRDEIFSTKSATGGGLQILLWNIDALVSAIINIIFSVSLTISLFRPVAVNYEQDSFFVFIQSPYSALIIIVLIVFNAVISINTTNSEIQKVDKEWQELARANGKLTFLSHIFSADAYIFNMHRIIIREEEKMTTPQYILRAQKHKLLYGTVRIVWNHLMMMAMFVFMAAKVFAGAIGIGDFLLYRSTVSKFINAVSDIALIVGKLIQNNDPLLKLFDYLDIPDAEQVGTRKINLSKPLEIEFKNVSYKYPGSDTWAVKDVSFKTEFGKSLALVGVNGSGKTTIIKLLSRLYAPVEGQILVNGIDILEYDYLDYINAISVVFQDYKLFSFTVAENIAASLEIDTDKVNEAIRIVGVYERVSSFPFGINTYIHKDYDKRGVNVSGGEGQKIAIARAIYKDAPLIIFDEPTAALDAIAEAEIYSKFEDLKKGKTSIFISHRLSSCRFCDNIIVLDNGKIIQQGTHEHLLSNDGGMYSKMWRAQAQYYSVT